MPVSATPEPTERSMPRMRITIVMPTEMTSRTEPWSRRFVRLPWVRNTPRVAGMTARQIHMSTSTAAIAQVPKLIAGGALRRSTLGSSFTNGLLSERRTNGADGELHDRELGNTLAGERAGELALAQDEDAVRETDNLWQVR